MCASGCRELGVIVNAVSESRLRCNAGCLEACRLAILPMIRACDIAMLGAIDQLGTAKNLDIWLNINLMTAFAQPGYDRLWESRFNANGIVRVHNPARRIAGRLRVLPGIEQPLHHLHVALVLHVAAHYAKGQ